MKAETVPHDLAALRALAVDASAPASRRAAALKELGRHKDFQSMPTVIAALGDETREVRGEAYEAAKQIVGLGIRFRAYDSPAKRQAAMAAYRRLLELAQQNNIRYLIDLVPVLLDRMDDENLAVRNNAGEDVVRLMDSNYGYRADAPQPERQRAIAAFRREWQEWNAPGSRMVEVRRDPEKMRQFKQEMLDYIRRKEARGERWTTDTRAADEAAEAARAGR